MLRGALTDGREAARMTGLGSAAAMVTMRKGGEKSNLLHERFLKLGALLTIVLVCFAQGVGTNI